MLRHLQALMERLKLAAQRVAPGGSTNEALLLASTFGLYALPLDRFPFVEALFPRPGPSIEASFDSGDSCSSGCGGGGGCGGCGS